MATPTLALSQRLDLVPAMLTVGLSAIFNIFRAPFRGSGGAKTFGRQVQNGITRSLAGRLSIAQLQYVRGTSTATFEKWASKQSSVEVSTENIGKGAKLHWIGDKKSTKVMLHIHGGGYILPLSIGHLEMLNYFRHTVKESTGVDIAIAILEYTLSSHAPYPTQFEQANAALNHLVRSGVSASNLIISGDSAGAHIALCVVSHILHPHPAVDAAPVLSSPFAGLLLISPRVTNATSAASFTENSTRDILTKETFISWITNFRSNSDISTDQGLARDGLYTEPLDASDEWWKGMATKVARNIFLSAGEHECMRDPITGLAENWKRVEGLDITFIVEEKGIHDSPLMDVGRAPSDLVLAVGHWLSKTVTQTV
ncbi:hypothetical protein EW146_g6762 [Bondarzewia mesenterica]|uniref:Alpha/beta hydrolase fold-3 domain-containing protein n=1 Tax=Bondarzewia mesenterica TaxID=1095465 RepID=A0A4S4LML7_9AGAM|nr:hypothetical protein EW146_g6762 [Bondarzewia mesenterica]